MILIIVVIVIFVSILVLIIFSIVKLTKRSNNVFLPKPVGKLTITHAPYKDLNAAPNDPDQNHRISKSSYKYKDFYGRFGYRAVMIGNGTTETPDKSSDIVWLDDLKIIHLKDDQVEEWEDANSLCLDNKYLI